MRPTRGVGGCPPTSSPQLLGPLRALFPAAEGAPLHACGAAPAPVPLGAGGSGGDAPGGEGQRVLQRARGGRGEMLEGSGTPKGTGRVRRGGWSCRQQQKSERRREVEITSGEGERGWPWGASWGSGGLHGVGKRAGKVMAEKSPGETCAKAPVPGEHRGSPGCGSCSSPSIWGASGFGFHCRWGIRGNEPVGAPLCCSSALTPPGFHVALCAKPPSAFQANMIFQALFSPTRAQCLPPINTCPTWLLGCLFSLHEQNTKK